MTNVGKISINELDYIMLKHSRNCTFNWRAVTQLDIGALNILDARCHEVDGEDAVPQETSSDVLNMNRTEMICAEKFLNFDCRCESSALIIKTANFEDGAVPRRNQ